MPTLNAAARNAMATAAGNLAGGGVLRILAGATVLVEHTMTGFGSPTNGVITANAISDETIAESGTADSAVLVEAGREVTLTIGTSGTEVIVPSLSYVQGGNSSINSVTITYPAS